MIRTVPRARAMRRAVTAALASVLAMTVLAGCTAGDAATVDVPALADGKLPDDTVAQMTDMVTRTAAEFGASGAIVGVWVPWSGSWVAGIGTDSTGADVTTDMSFRIGGVTREMTCDVLYGLVADRVVKLDDSVNTYVVGIPGAAYDGITLQMLCDGTSGIPNVPGTLRETNFTTLDRIWQPRELASFGLSLPGRAEPGAAYNGADTGYLLLGLALQQASGLTATELIAKYVATPLALPSTELPTATAAKPAPAPSLGGLYTPVGEGGIRACEASIDVTKSSSSIGFTDSGATSTISDLGRYARALASKSNARTMPDSRFSEPMVVSPEGPSWYAAKGGALFAGSLVGQAGATPGYVTAAFSDPATGLTVAVVLNNGTGGGDIAQNLAFELADVASKAPAASGETAPDTGMPWTADEIAQSLTARAMCPQPQG
ncbi:serine hydrolase domain-containing protein [Microbacterium gorillae]|uniref:serine hydrolase domain-containing protein n=1 Tax=Microbacterium gorillae TaxID=1231063 RepID=UPI003D9758DD